MVTETVVSIVTWNSGDVIEGCIQSILSQSYQNFEIIIVDNNSSDRTCDIINSFSDTRINLYKLSRNTGFCGGHNFAINNSNSEFILLVNPDVVLRYDYLKNALNRIKLDSSIGTVCGLLLQDSIDEIDEARIDSAGMVFNKNRIFSLRFHNRKIEDVDLRPQEVFGADGALPFYRRKMVEDISLGSQFFDEMFFAHKEDWDISWRSQILGWKTFFEPKCIAMHPRLFKPMNVALRSKILPAIKYNAVKNQLLLIIKNDDKYNFLRDSFNIIFRQLLVFIYILFIEPYSLKAYYFVIKNINMIYKERQIIQSNRRVIPTEFRNLISKA